MDASCYPRRDKILQDMLRTNKNADTNCTKNRDGTGQSGSKEN